MPPRSDRLRAEAPKRVSHSELLLAKCLGSSSWDPLIQAGLRSAVLRCPRGTKSGRECGGMGHWRDAGPSEAVHDERRAPDAADSDGEVWRSIVDVWECDRCGHTTRNPRIGAIGSMADCSWRGKGRLGASTNIVEISLVNLVSDVKSDLFDQLEAALIASCDGALSLRRIGGRHGGQAQDHQASPRTRREQARRSA